MPATSEHKTTRATLRLCMNTRRCDCRNIEEQAITSDGLIPVRIPELGGTLQTKERFHEVFHDWANCSESFPGIARSLFFVELQCPAETGGFRLSFAEDGFFTRGTRRR